LTGNGGGRLAFLPVGGGAPDPELFLSEVLDGWDRAQRAADLDPATVRSRRARVMDLVEFTGRYPWEWSIGDADEYFAHARGVRNLAHSTVRAYQGAIRAFCSYATDDSYDWDAECARLFGFVFSQVITDWNTVRHSHDSEARTEKRAFTQSELQQLFDLADVEADRILNSGRHGALAAMRDAVVFKVLYGWGLRFTECRHLQRVDLSRNSHAPYFGDYGVVRVRWGKAHRGSAKKTRSVLTVWDWSANALRTWVERGLPHFGQPITDLFPTGGGSVVSEPHMIRKLHALLDELGFPPGLDLHSFRRSYATQLITGEGFDVTFAQLQMGHAHAATTSIYTLTSPDYQRLALKRAHESTLNTAIDRLEGRTR
jgi:integrase